MRNVKQANINIRLKNLFKKWLEVTKPFHGLATQPQLILSLFLYYHFTYSRQITNDKILWKMVFDYDTKKKIKDELGISDQVMQNTLSKFRRMDPPIIMDGKINPAFVPNLSNGSKNFKVIYNFNIVDG